jgi:hypothetical protein
MKVSKIPTIRFGEPRDYSKVNRSALDGAMQGMTEEQKYVLLSGMTACLSVNTPPKRWTMALEGCRKAALSFCAPLSREVE